MADPNPCVVVPGNHDGVHLGHRALCTAALALAQERNFSVAALTFEPHPLAVLRPERAPTPLTTMPRRRELLLALGVHHVHAATFDAAYARQTPAEWVSERLVRELGARAVVIGPDYRFGAGRAGNSELLRSHGLEVLEVASVRAAGDRVSSSRVREALARGDVGLARVLLDRAPEVEGLVVEGHRRGRTIGFPTANLSADPVLLPGDGVYSVVGRVVAPDAERPLLMGMANLGTRPTFGAGRSIEAHFFDFDGDLYGKRVRLGFVERLRNEQKFVSVEALTLQLGADRVAARSSLASKDARWSWL